MIGKIKYVFCLFMKMLRRGYYFTRIPQWYSLQHQASISDKVVETWLEEGSWILLLLKKANSLLILDSQIANPNVFRVFGRSIRRNADDKNFWMTDHTSKFVHRKRYLLSLNEYGVRELADPVVIWEISRFQFVTQSLFKSKLQFPGEFSFEFSSIEDWFKNNPFPIGLIWSVPLESAMRLFPLLLVVLSSYKTDQNRKAQKYLWLNYNLLINKSLGGRTPGNNHRLIELTMLLVVMPIYPFIASKYYEDVLSMLIEEYYNQFYLDGHNVECATGYHAITIEVLALFLLQYQHSNLTRTYCNNFTEDMNALISICQKGLEIVQIYTKCFGGSPNFGDSSDSRLITGSDYFEHLPGNHSYLYKLFLNTTGYERSIDLKNNLHIYCKSGYGYYYNDKYGVCLNASKYTEISGHAHNDKTSWVFAIENTPFFVDPGTGKYNSIKERRKYFRSSFSHNIITIDSEEQSIMNFDKTFARLYGINSGIERINEKKVLMWHDGYNRFSELGVVRRCLEFYDSSIHILETLEGHGEHSIKISYLLHPKVITKSHKNCIKLISGEQSCSIQMPDNSTYEILTKYYSSAYGSIQETKQIVIQLSVVKLPSKFRYTIDID